MRRQTSRSYASIVRANALTIPNVILVVFGILTLAFDSWRDALFLGIVVANIAIGSFQEIRSKRELDRLAALVAPQAVVVRDGNDVPLPVEDVVVGDAVRVAAGDQIVADGTLVSADGLAVDESNLTGESKLVLRNEGDPVWSGTFAVEGAGLFEAKAVGADSRAEQLTATARTFRHPRSPLERANDRLLVGLVVLSLPLAIGLTASVLTRVRSGTAQVQAIVAGLANLIPEGLILLLSITAAVSAYRFARRGVLAQQLNAIESLASVDTLCTDKTGTLTEPKLRLVTLVPAAGVGSDSLRRDLARYAASSPSRNATLDAIADARLADVGASDGRKPGVVLLSPTMERARPGRRAARAGRTGVVRRRGRRPLDPRPQGGERRPARAGDRAFPKPVENGSLRASVPARRSADRACGAR